MSAEKRNLFNIRPCFFCFFLFCAGIFYGYVVAGRGLSLWFSLFVLSLPALTPCFVTRKKHAVAISLFACAFFFLGISLFLTWESAYHADYPAYALLSGKITKKALSGDGYRYFLSHITADGVPLSGKAVMYIPQELPLGSTFSASGKLSRPFGTEEYLFSENIRFTFFPEEETFVITPALSVVSYLREGAFSTLFSTLPYGEASVYYALVTGDSSAMEDGLLYAVRYGGIAHLFAVSGLHIGVVYGSLSFLMKKLRSPRVLNSLFCAAVALFYVAFCGFSASALRAYCMSVLFDLAFYLKARRDLAEVTSVAGFLLLCYRPSYLLSTGFRLSFLSVFALAFFSEPVKGVLSRCRIRAAFATPLSVSLAINAYLFPLLLDSFGYVSLWGVLLGVVLVPLVSFFFAPLLLLLLLAVLFPSAAGVILFLPKLFFGLFYFLFHYFDYSSFRITGFSFDLAALPYYGALLMVSDKISLKGSLRLSLFLILSAGCILLLFL